ncbi:MAG TPA: DUF2020 domain-containing protein [Pseudonocardiaceae bacterium]|jgi:hypothetical protein|nr:DUF2020 domain-containing protein [Pseudonocardiaceae bacterium]
MRRAALVLGLLGVLVVGCGPATTISGSPAAGPVTSHIVATSPSVAVDVPPAPQPAAGAPSCPYIATQDAADDNGQHVGSIKVSASADGQPHPTCFFYRPDGHLQLTVRVYVGTSNVATAIVDQAAPVSTSNPENAPAGWTGGSMALSAGAVYAIAKGGTAIVVTSNQLQTIKCKLVAVQVVAGLGA